MKKLFFAFLLIFSCGLMLCGNDEKITVSGSGLSPRSAVLDALNSACEQKYGMQIATAVRSQVVSSESFAAVNDNEMTVLESNDRLEKDIITVSKGRIKGYRILSHTKDAQTNKYSVTLEVYFPGQYIVGNNPDNRRRMVVSAFRINTSSCSALGIQINADSWERALNNAANVYLTHTRKFTMLDRNFDAEINDELARLTAPNASPRDTIRLCQKLGTDYLIVGTITFNNIPTPEVHPYTKKVMMPRQAIFATVDYRVILAATGQIKFADSVPVDAIYFYESLVNQSVRESAGYAARIISDSIISCILPYEIVGFNPDNTVVIGEGGKSFEVGEFLSVFVLGEEVRDSRTGEFIDQAEMRVGMVQVTYSTEKLTYAKIVEGKRDAMKKGSRLRRDEFAYRAGAAQAGSIRAPEQSSTIKRATSGGVVVPF